MSYLIGKNGAKMTEVTQNVYHFFVIQKCPSERKKMSRKTDKNHTQLKSERRRSLREKKKQRQQK